MLTQPRSAAQEALECLGDAAIALDTLEWLERQLRSLIRQLDAMLLDLASGLSIADLGFSEDEFAEMVEDLGQEISNLKALIQRARERGR